MSKDKKENTLSKYKGVSFLKNKNRWVAYIRMNGRMIHLGCFTNEEDAALAYNSAAKNFFGEFALINILKEKR